ncbi:MAG: sensor histidine kinase [candidate division NC10 bacterium]|nr:sensor histidine kinase [candidate division NC10 bacterium]
MLERVAILLGITLATHRTQAALVERVKELTCLHGIARAVGQHQADLPTILQEVAGLLPPAWQYPEVARAWIVLDGRFYSTPGFEKVSASQCAEIVVRGQKRGRVAVVYAEPRPPADEGPFLKEERTLIDSVAHELGSLVGRRTIEEERVRLQEQVRHADRLATIGELSAGVAHELNEPLATMLGFAQLCRKHPGLPPPAMADLDKIVAATLHAREIVKKLMLFARERPPVQERIKLERVITEGLGFVESRAATADVEIRRRIESNLPEVCGDPNQLVQVLVNLAVNAIQAMPTGGALTVEAYAEDDCVVLAVEDQGVGMTPEAARRVFEPFFTTKDVGEGTGLGLSVVHGIMTSHGGTIRVQSEPGQGSRFEVRLPIMLPDAPEASPS